MTVGAGSKREICPQRFGRIPKKAHVKQAKDEVKPVEKRIDDDDWQRGEVGVGVEGGGGGGGERDLLVPIRLRKSVAGEDR